MPAETISCSGQHAVAVACCFVSDSRELSWVAVHIWCTFTVELTPLLVWVCVMERQASVFVFGSEGHVGSLQANGVCAAVCFVFGCERHVWLLQAKRVRVLLCGFTNQGITITSLGCTHAVSYHQGPGLSVRRAGRCCLISWACCAAWQGLLS
jgi:hypothetical protein